MIERDPRRFSAVTSGTQPSTARFTLAANSSVSDFSFVCMKLSMIRAKGPLAFTAIVYTILVPFPAGVSSVVPIMSMFSASARKRPRRKGICSNVSVKTLIVCESGPILTVRVHRACMASRTSTFSTPGTHRPTCCMSLRKDHTFSTGAFTSNATVPSGIARVHDGAEQISSRYGSKTDLRPRSCSMDARPLKKESAEGLPRDASAYGDARADSALSQERKAGALVYADLAVLGHFVHRFAAFRFPLTEEVDRYFRSLLQFHISRVQRPSLVRVRHV